MYPLDTDTLKIVFFSNLLGVLVLKSNGVGLHNFLNTDMNPAGVLFLVDKTAPIRPLIHDCEDSHCHQISLAKTADFSPGTSNGSYPHLHFDTSCTTLNSAQLELVFVESLWANLEDVLKKISICSNKARWKPFIVVHFPVPVPEFQLHAYLERVTLAANISMNSQIFVLADSGENNVTEGNQVNSQRNWTLVEIYTIKGQAFVLPLETKLNISYDSDILAMIKGRAHRRANFHKTPILGSAENSPEFPLESQLETVNGEVRFVEGFSVDLFLDLEAALNFSAKAVQGEGWLSKDEATQKWIGTGRQIMAGEVDVGVTLTFHYESRAEFALLFPTYSGSVRAYFHQPAASSIADIFQHPFSTLVWVLMALVFSLTYMVLKMIIYFKKRLRKRSTWYKSTARTMRDFSEFEHDAGLFIIASICQQGWYTYPKSTSLKIVFLCTATAGYLMYVSFSAALVSTLTNEIDPIQSVEDLLASKLSIIGDMYIPFVVSQLLTIYHLEEWTLLDRNIAFDSSIINPTSRIAQEPCAYLGFSDDFVSSLRAINKSDQYFCKYVSNQKISKSRIKSGMVARKGSPYTEYFNYGVAKTLETGLNHGRNERYKTVSRVICDAKKSSYRQNLEIRDVFSAYVILGFGIAASATALLFERFLLADRKVTPYFVY